MPLCGGPQGIEMKILLLEDDHILSESLTEYLELEGFSVDRAYRGEEVFDLTFDNKYDLYILDINVPDINGFDVLKALKESGDETPAIYVTALTDVSSLSKGFSLGAEDYIKKPFDPEELVIRIKSKYQHEDELFYHKDICYNPTTRVIQKGSQTIGLGEVQKNIFHALMVQQNKIVDSYALMDFLEQPSANALRVNLAKLKSRLGIEIKNIRGQGYMIENI